MPRDYKIPPSADAYRIKIPASSVTAYPLYMELDQGTNTVLVKKDSNAAAQKWYVTPMGQNKYKIQSDLTKDVLAWLPGGRYGKGYLVTQASSSQQWTLEDTGVAARIRKPDDTSIAVDSCDVKSAHFWSRSDTGVNQRWMFELTVATPDKDTVRIHNKSSSTVTFGLSNTDPDTPEDETAIGAGQSKEFKRAAAIAQGVDSFQVFIKQGNTWQSPVGIADAGDIFEYP